MDIVNGDTKSIREQYNCVYFTHSARTTLPMLRTVEMSVNDKRVVRLQDPNVVITSHLRAVCLYVIFQKRY